MDPARKSEIINYIRMNVKPTDNSIAKLAAFIYGDIFYVMNVKCGEWGRDQETVWMKWVGPGFNWIGGIRNNSFGVKSEFRNLLSDEVAELIMEASRGQGEFCEMELMNAYLMLQNAASKTAILEECEARLFVYELPKQLPPKRADLCANK